MKKIHLPYLVIAIFAGILLWAYLWITHEIRAAANAPGRPQVEHLPDPQLTEEPAE